MLELTRLPTLVTYEGDRPFTRILVVVDESVMSPRGHDPLDLALETAAHIRRDTGRPVEVIGNADEPRVARQVQERLDVTMQVDLRRRAIIVREQATVDDLVVLPTLGDEVHLRAVASRLLRAVPDGASLLVAVAELASVDTPSLGPVAEDAPSASTGSP